MLPAVGVVTEQARCWQKDLADAPRTSIDINTTICEDLCAGETTTTLGWPGQAIAAVINVGYCYGRHALLSTMAVLVSAS